VKSCSLPLPAASIPFSTVSLFFGALLLVAGACTAPAQEKQLFSFTYADGAEPVAGLCMDARGDLFGTTKAGGPHGQGDVFELEREPNGSWTFKIIHAFGSPMQGTIDGEIPQAALIVDAKGNLYGTTSAGGRHSSGTAFELSEKSGIWSEKILYSFGAFAADGIGPKGSLLRDSAGNLYGTALSGGKYFAGGTVFELIPKATGEWTEKTLHSFGLGPDGYDPTGNLARDAKGNLYGTTEGSGDNGSGTVFELSPAGGSWKETILYPFGILPTGPRNPLGGVTLDGKGNLYGTSYFGGASTAYPGYGSVFELIPTTIAPWNEKILHSFTAAGTDGVRPMSNLIVDNKGNLYGTTTGGGANRGDGTVFEMSPGAGGSHWTFKQLCSFGHSATNGRGAYGGVVRDAAGNLYGTTFVGGTDNYGTVFEVVYSKAAGADEDEPDSNPDEF
jgi:uncharacterized repeat protein (TIGR03803 family)